MSAHPAAMDVLVIGAGVVGLTTAQALHADGHRVTVLEAAASPATGTSKANGGFLSPAYSVPFATPELPRQAWQSLFDSQSPMRFRPDGTLGQWQWLWALWKRCSPAAATDARNRFVRLGCYSQACLKELVAATGVEFEYRQTGVLQLIRQSAQQARAEKQAEAFTAQGFPTRWLRRDEVMAMEPGLTRSSVPLAGALHVVSEASGDCARFCHELLAWLQKQGVDFEPAQSVNGLWLDSTGQKVLGVQTVTGQRWSAEAVVVANGVAAPEVLKGHLRVPIQPVKGYSLTAQVSDEANAPRHALLDETSRLAVARFDQRIRLAGTAELVGVDLRIDPQRVTQLKSAYEALYPQTLQAPTLGWCGLRPTTPDGPPIVSATTIDGLWLNVGHGGYGWTLSCGSARLLADQISGQTPAVPAVDYALQR
ncbi:MAG: D-amino acid dehydrogenase [Betaproteobacteria bacterium]|jgi:D-amino-acid dehydrogenase|nr:D-amino acid dehydrogenase [Betaproteobacteria bacterium]MBP6644519.1 D-amino acid dehydrogenase [Burkholderiaceae bacterium]